MSRTSNPSSSHPFVKYLVQVIRHPGCHLAAHLSRLLRLTLLAPDIVEAILCGRHAEQLTLAMLREGAPAEWGEQEAVFSRR